MPIVDVIPDLNTRTRLLDAAQELIQRLGANAMSYQHLAKAVGIKKASVHHHFPTKEDLLYALLQRYRVTFLAWVDAIVASERRPAEKLRAYVTLFEATLREGKNKKACLCGMLGAELASLGSASVEEIRRFYAENEARLEQILEEGRTPGGGLRFAGASQPLAALIFALLEGAVLIARAGGGLPEFRATADQLFTLVGA